MDRKSVCRDYFYVTGNSGNFLLHKKGTDVQDAHSREDADCRKRPREGARICQDTFLYKNNFTAYTRHKESSDIKIKKKYFPAGQRRMLWNRKQESQLWESL